ncbi:hypothetical protein FSARC_10088 [Fusarium sarcochroum]|uniref:NYN domain-containing protein n=1 Tax=Fusarium sarcochroum TaxID=1208366 RepID=A0A8H4TPS4_9HYPO|nr:hypothetical protein FSARC_10088 [Fusarium sarcochroum]
MSVLPGAKHVSHEDGGFANIYIDGSNLWIQGRKTWAKKHSITVEEDATWRYDIAALKSIITDGFGFNTVDEKIDMCFKLYGSNLHVDDQFLQALHRHDVHVVNCKRSFWNGREKQVDTKLAVDMAVEATHALHWETPSAFALVSGDADLAPAVEQAAEHGYDVYVWSWKDSLAQVYTDLEQSDQFRGRIKVRLLDEYLEQMTFRNREFPTDRSVIPPYSAVLLDTSHNFLNLEEFLASVPFPHRKVPRTRNGGRSRVDDLVVVPLVVAEDTQKHDALLQMFQRICGNHIVMSYMEYSQNNFESLSQRSDLLNRHEEAVVFGSITSSMSSVRSSQDSQQDDFIVVDGRTKQQNKRLRDDARKSKMRCKWRKYCIRSTTCKYGHTREEEKFFIAHCPKSARNVRMCRDLDECFQASCIYAHTKEELFCPTCEATGDHEMQDCSENKRGS